MLLLSFLQTRCTGSARRSMTGAGRSSWSCPKCWKASLLPTPLSSRPRFRSSGMPAPPPPLRVVRLNKLHVCICPLPSLSPLSSESWYSHVSQPCHQNVLLASLFSIQMSQGSVNLELTASSFSMSGHNNSTADQQPLPVSNSVVHRHMTCKQQSA